MSNAAFRALTKSLDEPGQSVPQLVELFDLPPLTQQ